MVNLHTVLGQLAPQGLPTDVCVNDITLDSRTVSVGSLFVAIPGHQVDGRRYIQSALSAGATAVLAETDEGIIDGRVEVKPEGVIVWIDQLSSQLSIIADNFFLHPGQQLNAVAVTGTNGKSSVCYMLAQLCQALGEPSGVIGTLGWGAPGSLNETLNTTPDAITVQRTLRDFADQGYRWAALETSSHGLLQRRVDAVPFRYRVFTNLTRDHLDYHGDMASYRDAKWKLFELPGEGVAVINAEDPEGRALFAQLPAEMPAVLYGETGQLADYPDELQLTHGPLNCFDDGIRTELSGSWGEADLYLPLLGSFNVSNFLAAAAILCHHGFTLAAICRAAASLKPVPGRMELYHKSGQPGCIIDYAHTPDALEKALVAARGHCRGQLWCIFGCGGDRDSGKRPLMAGVAEQLADRVVVTSDNPRTEPVADIQADIRAGFRTPEQHLEIESRQAAIERAFDLAQPEDLILIAGKGHEDYQIVGTEKRFFSDRLIVEELLEAYA